MTSSGRSAEVSVSYVTLLGSYGVVFKGVRRDPNDLDDNGK